MPKLQTITQNFIATTQTFQKQFRKMLHQFYPKTKKYKTIGCKVVPFSISREALVFPSWPLRDTLQYCSAVEPFQVRNQIFSLKT